MEEMVILTLMLTYREKGIIKFLEEMRSTITITSNIVPMLKLLLCMFNIIDDKKDKGKILEFIQEYLNILKRKNLEE